MHYRDTINYKVHRKATEKFSTADCFTSFPQGWHTWLDTVAIKLESYEFN